MISFKTSLNLQWFGAWLFYSSLLLVAFYDPLVDQHAQQNFVQSEKQKNILHL